MFPKVNTDCKCKETCETMATDGFTCPTGEKCRPGCQCPTGMVEDDNGDCVNAETCSCYDSCANEFYKARNYAPCMVL